MSETVKTYRPRVLRFTKEGKYALLVYPQKSLFNFLIAELTHTDLDEPRVVKRFDTVEDLLEIPGDFTGSADEYIAELVEVDPQKGAKWKTLYVWMRCGKPVSEPCTCGWVEVNEALRLAEERKAKKQ